MGRQQEIMYLAGINPQLKRPTSSAKKQEWLDYALLVFNFLDANPSYWDALTNVSMNCDRIRNNCVGEHNQSATVPVQGHSNSVVIVSDESVSTLGSQYNMKLTSVQAEQHAPYHSQYISNTSSSSTTATAFASPFSSASAQDIDVEYINGIESIDIIKYPNGIPQILLYKLQQISQYKGFPSKLRYEQVKIKQEKMEPQITIQVDSPQTPFELYVVNELAQMGFQDQSEIMMGFRHIQKENPEMDANAMIQTTMLYIVQQREEKDEARKMDEARFQSEQSIILQERVDRKVEANIPFTADEMLGFVGGRSEQFPHSHLLKSSRLKMLFRALLDSFDADQGIVRKLLTIEKKAKSWYGDVSEAFFRYTLCEKIEKLYDKVGNTPTLSSDQQANIIDQLKSEINSIEKAIYTLSEQAHGLQVPKIFISSRDAAVSKGLIESDVIMIDDD